MGTVPNAGLDALATILTDTFLYIANGTGTTAIAGTDTALESENTLYGSARKLATTTHSTDGSGTSTWYALFSFLGAVTLREYGILSSSTGGILLYRNVLAANRTYAEGDSAEITVTHTFARS